MTASPDRAGLPLDRWINSLHEDANGLVWITKAELRAALAAAEPVLDVERERSNWPEWFSPDMAKGWIAAWDRVDGLLAATEPVPYDLDDHANREGMPRGDVG